MSDCQITCVEKPGGILSSFEHITRVGNPSVPWFLSTEDVIQRIEREIDTFYVRDSQGNRANVGVVRPANGRAYIRTYADGKWTDNLLSLRSCPL